MSPIVLMPLRDAVARQQERGGHAGDEDDALADVEPGERDVGPDRRLLIGRHGPVVAGELALLIAEILDRLVVQEAVDRLLVGVGVESFISRRIAMRQSVAFTVNQT